MADRNCGRTRPNEGMNSSMMRARNVTGRGARGAVVATALLAAGLPMGVCAQNAPAKAPPPPVVAPAAATAPVEAPPAAAPAPANRPMTEAVAAIVNDDIISTYDLAQRMRLLIATSGVQPTQETLPQFQREALISLVDERLQLQELRRVQKEQKISLIASDDE